MRNTRLLVIAGGLTLGLASLATAAATVSRGKDATPATMPMASAAAEDEPSVMERLSKLGYIDFNSYRLRPGGSVEIQALDDRSGGLKTIAIDAAGKLTLQDGWQLTHGPAKNGARG